MNLYDRVRAELGNPHIFQVSKAQMEEMEGEEVGNVWGYSSDYYPMIYIASGMTQKRRLNTIIHEILHLLYPHKPHWWITLAARRLAGGGHGDDGTEKFGHVLEEIPQRAQLLAQVRRQAKRYNER